MTKIKDMTREDLFKYASNLVDEINSDEKVDYSIEETKLKEIYLLLKSSLVSANLRKLSNTSESKEFNYEDLADLSESIDTLKSQLDTIKQDIEFEKFYRNGELYNWKKLRARFQAQNLQKRFPNFDWVKFKNLVKHPKTELTNYRGETIKYDVFMIRKFTIAIMQMLFNQMDLWIQNGGSEGVGKSCFASQQVKWFYTFLSDCGLVNYKYDIKRIIKGSLKELLEFLQELPNDSYFNISLLDEGEDLDRMNFRDEANRNFKSKMRRIRKNLNIVIINTPQTGELDTSLTLARVNIIFSGKMHYDPTTGLLSKGYADMFIIPRSTFTYSDYYKRNLARSYIKGMFSKQFEKKTDYYKDLPKEILIKIVRFYGVWGFNEAEYDDLIKNKNKNKEFESKGMQINENHIFLLMKHLPDLKHWKDLPRKKGEKINKDYDVLKKLTQKFDKYYTQNPERLMMIEAKRKYK